MRFQLLFYCKPAAAAYVRHCQKVSVNDFPIIIEGESGTEKELLAQAIHQNSRRHNGPFISLNISSLKSESAEAADREL